MELFNQLRSWRTESLRAARRLRALLAWRRASFAGVPVIFGNAMPKSGSKLLKQILDGMCQIGPFVETGRIPIRTITINGRKRAPREILADMHRLQPGDVTLGYLRASPDNIAALCRPDWAIYFIIRDPRDMLVSHLYYATEMYTGHGMHDYYNTLPDMGARLKVAIRGIQEDGLSMAGVAERYDRIRGWLNRPEILTVHFEDLILARSATVDAMLGHLEATGFQIPVDRSIAVERVMAAIDPTTSPTFRKGKVGDWPSVFTNEHKDLFKKETGDLLIQLGYEADNNW